MNMKKIIFCLQIILSFAIGGVKAQAIKNIYVVRHAEKDTGNNPVLSAAGKLRAGELYRVLKNKNIDLVFVSQYRRTAMTADSLRIYKHIDTVHYKADASGDDLFKLIEQRGKNAKNILIVGHSNTVPMIVRRAGATGYTEQELDDNEYDKLFVINRKKNKTSLRILTYGKPSATKARKNTMNILQ